jgi:hypothetical protein
LVIVTSNTWYYRQEWPKRADKGSLLTASGMLLHAFPSMFGKLCWSIYDKQIIALDFNYIIYKYMIKKIIGHCDVQHMILQTKTITSVFKDLTYMYIITSITAHPTFPSMFGKLCWSIYDKQIIALGLIKGMIWKMPCKNLYESSDTNNITQWDQMENVCQ